MKSYAEMDEMSADILKELGNIGTGNAITLSGPDDGDPLGYFISLPASGTGAGDLYLAGTVAGSGNRYIGRNKR